MPARSAGQCFVSGLRCSALFVGKPEIGAVICAYEVARTGIVLQRKDEGVIDKHFAEERRAPWSVP